MNIKPFLDLAAQCKTDKDANALLDSLIEAFKGDESELNHLSVCNSEFCMSDNGPEVSFQLNHVISEHYITMIKPMIGEGKFTCLVETNHMLDALGMHSKKWEMVEGMEEVWEYSEDGNILDINELTKHLEKLALINHRLLVERLGISQQDAEVAVQAAW